MAVIGESAKKINRTFHSDGGKNEMLTPLKGVEVQDPFLI